MVPIHQLTIPIWNSYKQRMLSGMDCKRWLFYNPFLFWLVSGTTLLTLPFWFCFKLTQFFLVTGREKPCSTILHHRDTFGFGFFFSPMSSFDRKGRREEGKTREICTSQLDQDELIASNELGQLIGRQIFASATSAAGSPFLVGKTKHPHEGLSTGIWCPKIQQSLSVCQGHCPCFPFQHKPRRHSLFLQHPFPLYPRIADCNFFS